jgi:hypothetical protein
MFYHLFFSIGQIIALELFIKYIYFQNNPKFQAIFLNEHLSKITLSESSNMPGSRHLCIQLRTGSYS